LLVSNKEDKSALNRFRDAFERLKLGIPEVLPKGSQISQNNVAREAGSDPSALRKSRYPILIMEIQEWVNTHKGKEVISIRQQLLKKRNKNRDTKRNIADLRKQRDIAVGMMVDANLRILELSETVDDLRMRLEALQPTAKILNFPPYGAYTDSKGK